MTAQAAHAPRTAHTAPAASIPSVRQTPPPRRRSWIVRAARGMAVAALGVGTLTALAAIGGVALLTKRVPSLPQPMGPYQDASEVFRWTDSQRPETLTPDPGDRRQVVAQAWYPTDAALGRTRPP